MNVEKSPMPRSAIFLKCHMTKKLFLGLLLTSLVILTPFANLRLMPTVSAANVEQNITAQYSVYGPMIERYSDLVQPSDKTGLPVKFGLNPAGNTKFGSMPVGVINIITHNPAESN